MAIHSSVLSQRISWTEEPGWLQCMGLQRVGHNWATNTHTTALFVLLLKLSQVCPPEVHSGWRLCSSDMPLPFCSLFVCLFWVLPYFLALPDAPGLFYIYTSANAGDTGDSGLISTLDSWHRAPKSLGISWVIGETFLLMKWIWVGSKTVLLIPEKPRHD